MATNQTNAYGGILSQGYSPAQSSTANLGGGLTTPTASSPTSPTGGVMSGAIPTSGTTPGQSTLINGYYINAQGQIVGQQSSPTPAPAAAGGGSTGTTPVYQSGSTSGQATPPAQINSSSFSQYNTPGQTLNSLLQSYIQSYNQSTAANTQRYNDTLAGYQDRYNQAMTTLNGLGNSQVSAINRQYDQLQGTTAQNAISSGLTNTTVAPALARGVDADRATAQNQLQDQLRGQQLQYQTGLSGDLLNFMQNANQQGPTLDQIGNIALAMGQVAPGYGTTGASTTATTPNFGITTPASASSTGSSMIGSNGFVPPTVITSTPATYSGMVAQQQQYSSQAQQLQSQINSGSLTQSQLSQAQAALSQISQLAAALGNKISSTSTSG